MITNVIRFWYLWRFLWRYPQLNNWSVQHQDKSFSAPKIRQINKSNASVQYKKPSVHDKKASVQQIKPSVQHIKSVSVLNWCFFCVELTVFLCWTDGFFVVNWRFFMVKWGIFGAEKERAFYVMIVMICIQAIGMSFNFTKNFSCEWQTF